MVNALFDTNVLVDLLRGYTPAHDWIKAQGDLGLSRIVWFEVMDGVKDKFRQRQALNLMREFHMIEWVQADVEWASSQLLKFRLSHNVGSFDCLIAAPSQRLQLPLYTRNIKHFTPMLGALAKQPYS